MVPEPYPLEWPEHWPVTDLDDRCQSRFKKHSFVRAWLNLQEELKRLGAEYVTISSNAHSNLDGRPRSGHAEPDNGAVAAYFHWKGQPYTIACDTYLGTWENARAITKTVEYMRGIERHGASSLLERVVSGFSALPPASDAKPQRPWWDVLGLDVGEDSLINPTVLKALIADKEHSQRPAVLKMVESLYRAKASTAHPDMGGSAEEMEELNTAIGTARASLGKQEDA